MAVEVSDNIGVIGTKGTVSSKAYYNAIKKMKIGANVYQKSLSVVCSSNRRGVCR